MDAGLSKQIRTMFPQVYEMYQRNCTKTANRQDLLGKVLFCPIRYNGSEWLVANLFAQDGFGLDKRYAIMTLSESTHDCENRCNTITVKDTDGRPNPL